MPDKHVHTPGMNMPPAKGKEGKPSEKPPREPKAKPPTKPDKSGERNATR